MSKSEFKIELINDKVNIISLNNYNTIKDICDNVDEILCINYSQDKSS